jgi:hypothetical protein
VSVAMTCLLLHAVRRGTDIAYSHFPDLGRILYERLEAELGDNSVMTEAEANAGARRSAAGTPNDGVGGGQRASTSQQSNSTPSNRRVIDYSPSPEDTKTAAVPLPTNGEARSGMKVTLKRNSHANGKEPSW